MLLVIMDPPEQLPSIVLRDEAAPLRQSTLTVNISRQHRDCSFHPEREELPAKSMKWYGIAMALEDHWWATNRALVVQCYFY